MMWLTLGLGIWVVVATAYAINVYFDLGMEKMTNEMLSEEIDLTKNSIRDIQDELRIVESDYEETREAIGVWKDRYMEAVNVHSLLADEREQSIGDRHDLVILGDQDVFVAYYHGELVVGQKRMSFNGYEDDTYRFEVTFGNKKDEGNVIYYDGEDY